MADMNLQKLQVFKDSVSLVTNGSWQEFCKYEGWNFNSGNYLFTTDTK